MQKMSQCVMPVHCGEEETFHAYTEAHGGWHCVLTGNRRFECNSCILHLLASSTGVNLISVVHLIQSI